MENDFENTFDLDDLSDEELRGVIRDQLDEYDTLDVDNIVVKVKDGHATLSGRVGTEAEREIADHVLSDVIGLEAYSNDLVIDQIRRDEEPEAADEHIADATTRGEDAVLGGNEFMKTDDEAERAEDDDEASLYGTHDVHGAIENGLSWNPPDEPTPEGRDQSL